MKKKAIILAGFSIFLIIFNIIFFVSIGDISAIKLSVWLSYGFIHLSYLLFAFSPMTIKSGSSQADYAAPTIAILFWYFIVELIIGLVFIYLSQETIVWALISQAVVAGIYIIWFLMALYANEHTASAVARHEEELVFVKQNSAMLRIIMNDLKGQQVEYKKVENCYDTVRMSPVKSSQSVAPIEEDIAENISSLEAAVATSDSEAIDAISSRIVKLTKKRNVLLQQERKN